MSRLVQGWACSAPPGVAIPSETPSHWHQKILFPWDLPHVQRAPQSLQWLNHTLMASLLTQLKPFPNLPPRLWEIICQETTLCEHFSLLRPSQPGGSLPMSLYQQNKGPKASFSQTLAMKWDIPELRSIIIICSCVLGCSWKAQMDSKLSFAKCCANKCWRLPLSQHRIKARPLGWSKDAN